MSDITELWDETMVTFLLGCSFSFEQALVDQVRSKTTTLVSLSSIKGNVSLETNTPWVIFEAFLLWGKFRQVECHKMS